MARRVTSVRKGDVVKARRGYFVPGAMHDGCGQPVESTFVHDGVQWVNVAHSECVPSTKLLKRVRGRWFRAPRFRRRRP